LLDADGQEVDHAVIVAQPWDALEDSFRHGLAHLG
jgi:hypothetical protein